MESVLTKSFILVLIWLSVQGQRRNPPYNLTVVYQANGSIRLTWEPSSTCASYHVRIKLISGGVVPQGHVTDTFYVLDITYPDTSYSCEVACESSSTEIGRSNMTVHTDKAEFRKVGTKTTLSLPRPVRKITEIVFNEITLFTFDPALRLIGPSRVNYTTVSLTDTNTELVIDSVTLGHAGYYYTMVTSGNEILGGKLLVVTGIPTKPTIRPDSVSPEVDSSVTMTCSSQSTSKPDNHGLKMSSSWKLNGTDVDHNRFNVSGLDLIIKTVRLRDRYNRYTCRTSENIPPPVQESDTSDDFILNLVYGPLSVTIEPYQRLPPLIIGEPYTPLVCKTECNPVCRLRWINDRTQPLTGKDVNTLTLNLSTVERKKEITVTCTAEHTTTGKRLEKNLTIMVYYPPNITRAEYSVDGSRLKYLSSISAEEGSNLVLILDIDSNPDAEVFIERTGTPGRVGIVTSRQRQYNITMNSLQCQQTGSYDIVASNFVTQNKSDVHPKKKVFDLFVKCTPRLISGTNHLIQRAGKRGDVIMFNVTVIAYPTPTADGSASVTVARVRYVNEYTYSVEGQVTIKQESDFRDYNVSITNNIQGAGLMVVIRIRLEDVPDTPRNFTVSELGHDYIRMTWTSGFNGGSEQLFHVNYSVESGKWIQADTSIKDLGKGKLHSVPLTALNPNTHYVIRLGALNKEGFGNYSEIKVTTLADLSAQEMSILNIALITTVVIFGFTITILLVILILRCGGNKNGQRSCRRGLIEQKRENDVELEGLNSGPEAQQPSVGPQYDVGNVSEVKGSSPYDIVEDVHTEPKSRGEGDYEDMTKVHSRTLVPHQKADKTKLEAHHASGGPQYEARNVSEVKGPSPYDIVEDVQTEPRSRAAITRYGHLTTLPYGSRQRTNSGDYEDMTTVHSRTLVPHKRADKTKLVSPSVTQPISSDKDEYIDMKAAGAGKMPYSEDLGHHDGKSQYEILNADDIGTASKYEKLEDVMKESRGCGERADYETLNPEEVGQTASYEPLRCKRGTDDNNFY